MAIQVLIVVVAFLFGVAVGFWLAFKLIDQIAREEVRPERRHSWQG